MATAGNKQVQQRHDDNKHSTAAEQHPNVLLTTPQKTPTVMAQQMPPQAKLKVHSMSADNKTSGSFFIHVLHAAHAAQLTTAVGLSTCH